MSQRGRNLPKFAEVQLEFAAHIRNPEVHARPSDIEPRRMQIYLDLFYNNVESFLASGFPVAKKVLGKSMWHELVRGFVHRHGSESPYFLEITQEFLTFLDADDDCQVPDYLLELCHYEWVELALSTAEDDIPTEGIDPAGDLLEHPVVVSPLIWPLSYRYAVHQIGVGHVPSSQPSEPSFLIVYRRRDDQVKFMESSQATHRLLEILVDEPTGSSALETLQAELSDATDQRVHAEGLETLEKLRGAQVILGVRQ